MANKPNELVQQGLTAARVGDVEEARRLLQEATAQDPAETEAWLGLAGVAETLEEKRDCFQKVLALEPENQEARAGLERVEQKLAPPPAEETGGLSFCYRHPNVETGLRCNRCNRPICPKCAQRTPVGFRCPECIREQENKFYSGTNLDYIIGGAIAFPLSLAAVSLITYILGSFGFFTILIGFFAIPAIAGFIAEAVRWGVQKRRSRYLGHVAAGGLILATLPVALFMLLSWGIWGVILPGMFIFFGAPIVFARLR